MAKIYLSPAAHEHDNPCSYSASCGENIHCNLYMDYLETALIRCGFEVKRNPKSQTGSAGVKHAVTDSNEWGADLHYIAHTNAGGGSYSLLITYDTGKAYTLAQMLKSRRRKIYSGIIKLQTNPELFELNQTAAPAIYDELTFHDNKNKITWFHENMRQMAENTCEAICAMFNKAYIIDGGNKMYYIKIGAFETAAEAQALADLLAGAAPQGHQCTGRHGGRGADLRLTAAGRAGDAVVVNDKTESEPVEPAPVASFDNVARFRADTVYATAANALNRVNALPLSSAYKNSDLSPTQTYYDGKVCRFESVGFFHIDDVDVLD